MTGEMSDHLISDRLRRFGANFAAAAGTERARRASPKQFQEIVDLCDRTNARERRFSAPARAGDHAQLSKRKIEIDAFEVILARPADFNAPALSQSSDAVFSPVARTHWRQSFHAMRSANSVESPPVRGRHPERKRGTSLKLVDEVAESLTVCAVRDDGMEAEEESSEGVRT